MLIILHVILLAIFVILLVLRPTTNNTLDLAFTNVLINLIGSYLLVVLFFGLAVVVYTISAYISQEDKMVKQITYNYFILLGGLENKSCSTRAIYVGQWFHHIQYYKSF